MDFSKVFSHQPGSAAVSRIVRYVGDDAERFGQLARVFADGPYRITQRATPALLACMKKNPRFVTRWLAHVLPLLNRVSTPAVRRNTLRCLQFVDVPGHHRSAVASLCFKYLADRREAVAVRVFAMTVLAKLARSYPELGRELSILVEDEMPYGSAAFSARARRLFPGLSK